MNFKLLYKDLRIRVGALLLALLLIYSIFSTVEKSIKNSKKFSTAKISINQKPSASYENKEVSEENLQLINLLLDQPYTFLGKGKQCFAFESADGKCVVKFIKQDSRQLKKLNGIFSPITNLVYTRKKKKKEYKHEDLVNSIKIAETYIPTESGLIFSHLNTTVDKFNPLTLLDKKGCLHTIDPDTTQFIIQRKADFIKPVLVKLMYLGNDDLAKERIHQIFSLLKRCALKGISDKDGAMIRNNNIGFLENSAIYIDIGRLTVKGKPLSSVEFEDNLKVLRPLYNFLVKNYPTLAECFISERDLAIKSLS